jgi:hypothetical protein
MPTDIQALYKEKMKNIRESFNGGSTDEEVVPELNELMSHIGMDYTTFGQGKKDKASTTRGQRSNLAGQITKLGGQINTLKAKKHIRSKDMFKINELETKYDTARQNYAKIYKEAPPGTFGIGKYGRGKGGNLPKISVTKSYGTATTPTIIDTSGIADSATINYSKMILTIIEVLTKIADNTDKLDRIIDLIRKYGPSMGIDTSGMGKGKTSADTTRSIRATIQNHKTDPSWAFSAMNHMNQEAVSDNFMESVLALARE